MRECADREHNAVPGGTIVGQGITLVEITVVEETTVKARKSGVSRKSADKEKAGDRETGI